MSELPPEETTQPNENNNDRIKRETFASLVRNAKFRYPWRKYQKRILEQLDAYLDDRKIHVIAPPGSGKTVLGLEILRRLSRKTLVLSPTIAIRDQWTLRWKEDFETGCDFSTDAKDPEAFLRSATYQSLYSAFRRKEEIPSADVLVVDEAHHLRREWWKALEFFVKKSNPVIIALTATPPWDVEDNELKNYLSLCGNVDEEISVPELVQTGDLCPHQDYLHIGLPDEESVRILRSFQDEAIHTWQNLPREEWIQKWAIQHPFLADPSQHWDDIYREPDFFLALVSLAHTARYPIHPEIQEILTSEKIFKIPLWNSDMAVLILDRILQGEKQYPEFQEEIKIQRMLLRKKNILKGKKLDFTGAEIAHRYLVEGSAKIQGIQEIIQHEMESLGSELCMVILTDFIRKDSLYREPKAKSPSEPDKPNTKILGTVPLFQEIYPRWKEQLRIAHVTGSLVMVSETTKEDILGILPDENFKEVSTIPGAYEWNTKSQISLPLLTQFLIQGKIHIMIGTMSLLGEGWDAPAINSLVLATSVGSYMLSNQSRGRAIRTFKSNPNKVSNIWHLTLIDLEIAQLGTEVNSNPSSKTSEKPSGESNPLQNQEPSGEAGGELNPLSSQRPSGESNSLPSREAESENVSKNHPERNPMETSGHEFREMQRRFRAFAGPSFFSPIQIETGLDRMGLRAPSNMEELNSLNEKTFRHSDDRLRLKKEWELGIGKGENFAERLQVRGWENPAREASGIGRSLSIFGLTGLFHLFLILGANALDGIVQNYLWKLLGSREWASNLSYALFIPSIALLPRFYRTFRDVVIFLFWKGTRLRMANACRMSLEEIGLIGKKSSLRFSMKENPDRSIDFLVEKGLLKEREYFIRALEDLFRVPDNPRYIIRTHIGSFRFFGIRYFQVPEALGRKKELAEAFLKNWNSCLGPANLIYTRTPQGRPYLFRARIQSIFRDKIDLIRGGVWI